MLVDRSLFERELLRPGSAQGPAPHAFRATQFRSFVRQLYRYGFRKVPGRAGAAAPGDAGAWVHYTNPWFRRDRPDLLLRIRRRSAANTQRRRRGRRAQAPALRLPAAPRALGRCRRSGTGALASSRCPGSGRRSPGARPAASTCCTGSGRGRPRREGPSRFQELYGERPLPAERELLRVPPCHFQGFHGEQLLPPRWEGPRSRMQELYGEQPPSARPGAALDAALQLPAAPQGAAAPSLQPIRLAWRGNINVAPESPGEDPMNRAAAEEASSGTESCRNSSPEPEEPGLHRVQVVSSCDLSNGESMDPTAHFASKQRQDIACVLVLQTLANRLSQPPLPLLFQPLAHKLQVHLLPEPLA
ncbi:hypothetical protein DUI87_24396 [Hirundo rustica rustica]|uniref:HSF-type DNA-binding domain-containing protein n=1 Tax=Hirundo rustica rustica TaxID=333673 RepID=A0A3M0JEI8_HIRRU|nr:hypothetical protein DUI87_24396 [Hirundo rustica rustica]